MFGWIHRWETPDGERPTVSYTGIFDCLGSVSPNPLLFKSQLHSIDRKFIFDWEQLPLEAVITRFYLSVNRDVKAAFDRVKRLNTKKTKKKLRVCVCVCVCPARGDRMWAWNESKISSLPWPIFTLGSIWKNVECANPKQFCPVVAQETVANKLGGI